MRELHSPPGAFPISKPGETIIATAAQILANRANAQHSTGPKTAEGKQATAQNALRHGLAAKGFLVAEGQEEAFAELESSLTKSLQPESPLQQVLFKRILESAWHLERCRLALVALSENNHAPEPMLDPYAEAHAARIQKYSKEAENSMYKAMREFSKLKTEDQFRHETFPISKSDLEDPAKIANTPHAASELCDMANTFKNFLVFHKNTRSKSKTPPPSAALSQAFQNAPKTFDEFRAAHATHATHAAKAA